MTVAKVIAVLTLSLVVLGNAGHLLPSEALAGGLDPSPAREAARRPARPRGSQGAVQWLRQEGLYDSLATAVEATRYRVRERQATKAWPTAYEAANPSQGFLALFAPGGMEMRPGGERTGWRMGMRLSAWGYEKARLAPDDAVISGSDNRVEYRYQEAGGAVLKEWYVNTTHGIEQGFTLTRSPAGGGRGQPLTLVVAVSGDLAPRLAAGGQAIEFAGADGTAVLRYAALRAWDAAGRTLASRLAVGAKQIRLVIDDTSAVYPVTVDPLISSETKLDASDGTAGDLFGFSAAISEDASTVVVGADQEQTSPGAAGKAYVYVRNGTTWSQQATLTPSDGAAGDQFGFFLAISGDTVVVGAPNHNSRTGQAYVYVRSGTTWSEQAKLTASDGAAGDQFGWFVGISGDTVVVGAPFHSSDTGQAYVYVQSGTTWTEQAKLTASDGAADDQFAFSVAIDGDTVAVGAPQPVICTFGCTSGAGEAYIYVRSGTTWSEQAKLLASDGAANDQFGSAVAVSGDTVVIGAPQPVLCTLKCLGGAGKAYIFVRSGTTWSEQSTLLASDGASGDFFGNPVAISADLVVVGAQFHATGGKTNAGQAYVYERSGTTWSQQTKLTASDGAAGDSFGWSAAVSGVTVVVGAPGHASLVGEAYVDELAPPGQLTALGPAQVWVGIGNSTSIGIRFDLKAKVYLSGAVVGSGRLKSVDGGLSPRFSGATLNTIPLTLTSGLVDVLPGSELKIRVWARNACAGSSQASGTARLWFNGNAVDAPCGPFVTFGTWSITLP